jgi:hypothetical protein
VIMKHPLDPQDAITMAKLHSGLHPRRRAYLEEPLQLTESLQTASWHSVW